MNRRTIVLALLGLSIATLAIAGILSGESPSDGNTGDSGEDGNPETKALIQISRGPGDWSTAGPVEGTVTVYTQIYGWEQDVVIQSPSLCLYDSDGNLLYSATLPPINTSDDGVYSNSTTFSVDAATLPAYMVVDHPALRDHPFIRTEILVYDEEQDWYTRTGQTLGAVQDDFVWPRSSEPGQCG